MPYCNKCGQQLGENDNFCNKCGTVQNNQSKTNVNINVNSSNQNPKKGKITGGGVILAIIAILIVTGVVVSIGIGGDIATNTNTETNSITQGKEKDIDIKKIIRIKSVTTSKPDIVGGVDLDIQWTNNSDKTIKYIYFTAYPINAVGDIVSSEISVRKDGKFEGKETGPIKKGEGSKSNEIFRAAWYNNTIVKAKLTQVDIEYMDGSKVSLSGKNLDKAKY